MTRLEIIELRTVLKNNALEAYLAQWLAEAAAGEKKHKIRIYRHAELENDYSIHFQYDPRTADNELAVLAQRLASVLKEFGLVNHTIWIERQS